MLNNSSNASAIINFNALCHSIFSTPSTSTATTPSTLPGEQNVINSSNQTIISSRKRHNGVVSGIESVALKVAGSKPAQDSNECLLVKPKSYKHKLGIDSILALDTNNINAVPSEKHIQSLPSTSRNVPSSSKPSVGSVIFVNPSRNSVANNGHTGTGQTRIQIKSMEIGMPTHLKEDASPSKSKQRRTPNLANTLEALWKMKMLNPAPVASSQSSTTSAQSHPVMRKVAKASSSSSNIDVCGTDDMPGASTSPDPDSSVTLKSKLARRVEERISSNRAGSNLYSSVKQETARVGSEDRGRSEEYRSSDQSQDLLETTATGYAPSAPQYVTDFSSMEYPLSTHINPATNYVYATDNSYPYYQYSGNIHSPGNNQSYMLQHSGGGGGGQSPNSGEDDANGLLGHTTRASPQTIAWLLDNYETADTKSLPRCQLYDHYKRHCNEHRLDPVNAASFGKLIRSVFLGLRTRRLGTRGNSKYHYYGIQIKPDSQLALDAHHQDYSSTPEPITPRPTTKRPANAMSNQSTVIHSRPESSSPQDYSAPTITLPPASSIHNSTPVAAPQQVVQPPPSVPTNNGLPDAAGTDRASLGEGEVPDVDLTLEGFDEALKKIGLDYSHVMKFKDSYRANCAEVLDHIKMLEFDNVEESWTTFWQPEPEDIEEDERFLENQDRLTQQQLFSLCTIPHIQSYSIALDIAFYQTIVDVLVPNVLMSKMTPSLTQGCRNFAKNVESYLKKAMQGAPESMQKKKLQAVKYMAQGLRRYTSLNHLAQAARAVLQKQEQVSAMYGDYMRMDINQVQEQAGWVCGCDPMMVLHIHNSFRDNLERMAPMEVWAEWLESIVDQILAKYHDKPVQTIAEVGKQFLLNWSFYTSMMIRDLTLRSATSFGSFHLIRLLTDEYMIYLIETRIAKAAGRPVISIINQPSDFEDAYTYLSVQQPQDRQGVRVVQHTQQVHQEQQQPRYMMDNQMMYLEDNKYLNEQNIERQVLIGDNGDILDIGDLDVPEEVL